MHQRGGLQRLSGSFVGHLVGSQCAQFTIDLGPQFPRRLRIALAHLFEQARDFPLSQALVLTPPWWS